MDQKRPLTANQQLSVTIFTAFFVMFLLSSIAFCTDGGARQPPAGNSFWDGFRQGFASGHVSRTLISALLFSVIAGIRRRLLTTAGAVMLIVLAAFHSWHYAASFPSLGDALTTLVPALLMAMIGPASWVEYFLVFRVYRAWRAKQINDKLAQNISPYPDT
jgi:hypothetical protein